MISHLLFFLLLLPAQDAKASTRVIASTKEWSITADQFDAVVKSFPEEDQLLYVAPQYRRGLVNELVRIWVLCADARRKGAEIGTDYQAQKEYYQVYAGGVSATFSDQAIRAFYDAHVADFTQLRFSHILILNGDSPVTPYPEVGRLPHDEAEQKAKEIKAMLDAGGNWDEISKQYSQAMDVRDKGGDVGYVARGQLEQSIESAVASLKVGETSEVITSSYGFHIIRVTERKVTPFEELRGRIRQKLVADDLNRRLEPMVKEAGVTIDESFFQ